MSNHEISTEQWIDLVTAIALLKDESVRLAEKVAEQDRSLKELLMLAERGKGSVWGLVAVGGIVGAFLANAKAFLALFIR